MQFLRTLLWVVIAVVGVIFAFNNSQRVDVRLWSDIIVETPLWMVAMLSFLLGLVPMLLVHRATRWRLRRRLESANRTITDTQTVMPPAPAPLSTPISTPISTMPPGAAPIVPPPGVA